MMEMFVRNIIAFTKKLPSGLSPIFLLWSACVLISSLASATGLETINWEKQGQKGDGVPDLWVRPGYKVTLVAKGLKNARFLENGSEGIVYLSRPNTGDIVTLQAQPDGSLKEIGIFVSGKPRAHGMQWKDGWLWFTQSDAIFKARDTNSDGKADEVLQIVGKEQLESGGGHWWRPILVSTSTLYTSIGDAGNIEDGIAKGRETALRFNLDGTGKSVFATGIRNTEKLRFRPGTDEIWGCDHGSDWFGGKIGDKAERQPVTDMNPPDELNRYVEGGFYGHPFVTGNKMPRIEFQNRPDIIDLADKTIAPEWCFNAHWAVNGFCFLEKDYFGSDHKGDLFAALHGSWNRKVRSGYRVERVLFDKLTGRPYGSLMIVSCLNRDGKVADRPVDCLEAPDGTILFSCDQSNSIYRISKVAE